MGRDYIILIKWDKDLPHYYRELVALFKAWGIGVLPLRYEELSRYHFNTHRCVLSITTNLEEQKHKSKALNSFLSFVVKRGKITLYDISSYSNLSEELEYFGKYYTFLPLPMTYRDLVKIVATRALVGQGNENHWPGGKSSKLPYDVQENGT